jgi:hypothetical protein
MPTALFKPPSPQWQPGEALAGRQMYLPLCDASGSAVRDVGGSGFPNGVLAYGGVVGAPGSIWQRGFYGPELAFRGGGNTADNAGNSKDRVDFAANTMATSTEGATIIVMAKATTITFSGSAGSILFCHGVANSSTSAMLRLEWNKFAVCHQADTTQGAVVSWTSPSAGAYHVIAGAWDGSGSVNGLSIWIDGVRISTTPTLDALNVSTFNTNAGAKIMRLAGQTFDVQYEGYWAGSLCAVVYRYKVSTDAEMLALANDLLSGQFSAVRPPSKLTILTPAITAGGPAADALNFANDSLSGGLLTLTGGLQ